MGDDLCNEPGKNIAKGGIMPEDTGRFLLLQKIFQISILNKI
jgi:hypothetical protein